MKFAPFSTAFNKYITTLDVKNILKMIFITTSTMWELPFYWPCSTSSFYSTDPADCWELSLKSDRSAVKSPHCLPSSVLSAPLPQIFSFCICKMRSIQITTSWVVVRVKYDDVGEALSVLHTEQCDVLLKFCLLWVPMLSYWHFVFSLSESLLVLLIPDS